LLCTIRESKGLDISAACGQLKEKDSNESSWLCNGYIFGSICYRIRNIFFKKF
jgi:hypothetical protein